MTTLSASSSRPADAGYAAAATLVAVVLFLFSWALLHRGFFAHDPIVDTPVYERYGSAIDSGQVPYRDFALEYPPGALPVFVLPALGGAHGDSYRRRFEALMALLGELMLVTVAVALAALGAGRRWLLAALGLAAVAPLLLGPVVLSRFDLWPAALTAIALAALAGDRLRLGHLALGAAVAAKLYAAVLVPIALVYVWRRRGRREALVCGALLLAVVAIAFVPFLIVAPRRRLGQPLEPGLSPAADREPRRGAPARLAPRLRHRRDDGVEPRLAEPRRHDRRRVRRRAVGPAALDARSRSGSCSRAAPRRGRGSSTRAPPPWSRSSRSARCSPRSS